MALGLAMGAGRVVVPGRNRAALDMLTGDDLALPYPWLMRNSVTVRTRNAVPMSPAFAVRRSRWRPG